MEDRLARFWREWRGFFLFVVVMLLFRSAIADWNQVPSGSMKPSIIVGDRIVVDKLAYDLRVPFTEVRITQWGDPERGDIVTFENRHDGRLFVKRVIAVPGDTVELKNNRLVVNGELATYTPLANDEISAYHGDDAAGYRFLREQIDGQERVVRWRRGPSVSARHFANFSRRRVEPGMYWMMGDNRDDSSDSRVIGAVPREAIYGRAHAIAFSLDYERYYFPRLGRFFTDLPDPDGRSAVD